MGRDVLFAPLRFRNLEVGNRILRANIAGRFDHYDGTGTQARINWEVKFARAGVGAIVSSWTGVDPRGRIVPNFATIDRDERIPFWRELGEQVRAAGSRYILQLAHAGRQRDIPGFESAKGLSATDKPDPLHGFECERMTREQIGDVAQAFARAAGRAREAGLDGVEIHGANGYLFTQFLSSAINDRTDEYGGPLENRARFLLETLRGVRAEVGDDFHVQVKISTTEHGRAFLPWAGRGNGLEESVQVCRWLEDAGADAIHVSSGNTFPHPENPAGAFSVEDMVRTYDVMLSGGVHTFRNYLMFRAWPLNRILKRRWERDPDAVEGRNLADAEAVKRAVSIPVLCTGGFQTASVIADAIERGACDAVTIARGLVANPDLVGLFRRGHDRPPNPCTFCNKCLYNVLEHPLGCYDERRFGSRAAMLAEIMSVYAAA
jgi:2,4-dienoyl-CoA reductase-like NADH-dependent reductase (Old Yellow Enzyme family)